MSSPNDCAFWKILLIWLAGACFLALGGLSLPFLKQYVHDQVTQEIPLREPPPTDNGSNMDPNLPYNIWKDIPVPMHVSFRFFHVQNPLEIVTLGEKPYLTERGPYVYSEKRHKKNIVFAKNGTIVSFNEIQVFHFVPEMSAGDEDDELRLLNVPFLTVLNQAKDRGWFVKQALKVAVATTGTKLFETKPVRQWLWGYNDTLLELLKLSQPDVVPFTYFGWFMNKNNTDPGRLTIDTGVGGVQHEADIISWKNQTALDVWTDSYCNAINGTDGSMFHPFVNKNDTLYMFSSDICRSIYVQYEKDSYVKGLHSLKFVPPESVFADVSVNPDNGCWCVPDLDHCLGAGVLNISSCQFGAPVVSSSPHLFQADPIYLKRLNGLNPSKSKHQTFIEVEPLTGMVLNAAKRLQVNAFVDNIPTWSNYFEKFPDKLIFPILWIEESAKLDDQTAATVRGQVTDKLHLVLAIQVTLFVFGGFLISVVLLLLMQKMLNRRLKRQPPALIPVKAKSSSSVSFENHLSGSSPLPPTPPPEGVQKGVTEVGHGKSINSQSNLPDWLAKISK